MAAVLRHARHAEPRRLTAGRCACCRPRRQPRPMMYEPCAKLGLKCRKQRLYAVLTGRQRCMQACRPACSSCRQRRRSRGYASQPDRQRRWLGNGSSWLSTPGSGLRGRRRATTSRCGAVSLRCIANRAHRLTTALRRLAVVLAVTAVVLWWCSACCDGGTTQVIGAVGDKDAETDLLLLENQIPTRSGHRAAAASNATAANTAHDHVGDGTNCRSGTRSSSHKARLPIAGRLIDCSCTPAAVAVVACARAFSRRAIADLPAEGRDWRPVRSREAPLPIRLPHHRRVFLLSLFCIYMSWKRGAGAFCLDGQDAAEIRKRVDYRTDCPCVLLPASKGRTAATVATELIPARDLYDSALPLSRWLFRSYRRRADASARLILPDVPTSTTPYTAGRCEHVSMCSMPPHEVTQQLHRAGSFPTETSRSVCTSPM